MKFNIIEDGKKRYEELVCLYNTACAPRERSIEEMLNLDSRRRPEKFFVRLLATSSTDRILGYAEAGHDLVTNDNDTYVVDIQVALEFQGHRIGASLYSARLQFGIF